MQTTSTFSPNSGQVVAYSSSSRVNTQFGYLLDAANMTYQGNLLTGYTEGVAGNQYSFTYDAERRLQHATAVAWQAASTEVIAGLSQAYDQTFSFCSNSSVPVYAAAPATCGGLGTLTGVRSPNVADVVYQYGQGEQVSLVSGRNGTCQQQ